MEKAQEYSQLLLLHLLPEQPSVKFEQNRDLVAKLFQDKNAQDPFGNLDETATIGNLTVQQKQLISLTVSGLLDV